MYELIDQIETIVENNQLSVAERMDQLLEFGIKTLKMENGIVSQIRGTELYRISRCITTSPEPIIKNGQTLQLNRTYGSFVIKQSGLIFLENVFESEFRNHVARRTYGWDSYIGVPLILGTAVFGALEFSSVKPRKSFFTETECNLVYVMGASLAALIERDMQIQRTYSEIESRKRIK